MAERLQAGGRDQEPDEAGEVTSGLDARGRGDGHSSQRLGQVPQGPEPRVCITRVGTCVPACFLLHCT